MICDDPEAPDIHLLVVRLSVDQFWRHVEGRTQHQRHAFILFVKLLGESQIRNLDLKVVDVFRNKKDVLWLHVTMSYGLQVQIVEAHHDLHCDVTGLVLCEVLNNLQPLEQFTSLDNL